MNWKTGMWGTSGIPVIDLFAGMGGLGVGASTAGADVRLSIEMDRKACETLRLNGRYHGQVLEADVRDLKGRDIRRRAGLSAKESLIIVGGAPCQPFSKAAYWTEAGEDAAFRRARSRGEDTIRPERPTAARPDERRSLIAEFWRLIHETKADGFVFENVPSIKHPRNKPVLDEFMRNAAASGFKMAEVKRNAAEHGVAQTRERVFILGSKACDPKVPEPTHYLQGQAKQGLRRAVTAGEALARLVNLGEDEPEIQISGRWAQHLADVPPGWNYKAHTAWAGHPSPTFETETRFWNFLLKLSPERPSWTLAASPGPWTGPFHWESRRLKTSEMAALQGFPEGFNISGSRRDRVRQVGNAVPPPLACAMIASVMRSLER